VSEFDDIRQVSPVREPAFNVPWPVWTLLGVLVLAHLARLALGIDADQLALLSTDLPAGRLSGLLTYQFVHGSWVHLAMNSVFILAFGSPVARFLSGGLRGALAFFAFFLVCGAAAAIAFAGFSELLDAGSPAAGPWALVGASGAASGLMAAAARLIQGRGQLGPITGSIVVGMTAGWIAMNLVLGISGLTPGAAGVPVAWQAHIFGYLFGLLAIAPAGWVAGVKGDHAIAL
jgi:membrane associated rhomboid family serine protease